MEFDENSFKEQAEKQILRCRAGDWNHAKRVVSWIKKIGEENSKLKLIIAAGYIHDIGWRDVLPDNKLSLDKLLEYEPQANKNSKKFAREFLRSQEFSNEEVLFVLKLIEAADKHESSSEEEAIIVDADNLSKLSADHIKEKFDKSEWVKMYNYFEEFVPERIKTLKGKEVIPKLLEKLKKQIMPG